MFIYDNVEKIADIYATINCFNPVPAFYDSIKLKNYNAIPPNYYIMASSMNFSWVIYAQKTGSDVLYNVSLKYSLLYIAFALISIYYRKEYKKLIQLILVFIGECFILSLLDLQYLGLTCTIVQFISDSYQWEPIISAYKSKNPTFINLKQQFIAIVSSTLWTIIGIKANDPFLIYPNGYNTLLRIIQISVGTYYGGSLFVKEDKKKDSE